MSAISIHPQKFQGVPSWAIYYGKVFLCYTMTRLAAEKAKKEIAKILPAMPDPNIPARPLTDSERKQSDEIAHFEQIDGVLTIDRRDRKRPGMNERLICWRLSWTERIEAFRYGVVSRIIHIG